MLRRFSICRIAELHSAERRIGPTLWSFPSPGRVQLCDTAEYNSALRWSAIQFQTTSTKPLRREVVLARVGASIVSRRRLARVPPS